MFSIMNFKFNTSDIIRDKISGLKFGILLVNNLKVRKNDAHFDDAFNDLRLYLQEKFNVKRPAEDAVVSHVRRMYRRTGWEPTRYRPSSEALIRRILKGNTLYRINNLVDFGNLTSARFHLPMGLYDAQKITGNIMMDVGQDNESYRGISNPEIHAQGKLILRDDNGIFGNPTADSLRTSITEKTSIALAVFFCPPEIEDDYLKATLDYLSNYYKTFSGDTQVQQEILCF